MILYDYFRSSAAFRVRIALNVKGLAYERRFVHLRKNEQRAADYLGNNPTLADVCLVPQVFNSQRLNLDLARYPRIRAVHEACMALPAFADAQPSRQPDAE